MEAQRLGHLRAGCSVPTPTVGSRGKWGVREPVWEECGLQARVTQETSRQSRGAEPEGQAVEWGGWATGHGEVTGVVSTLTLLHEAVEVSYSWILRRLDTELV